MPDERPRILVIGATGVMGREVMRSLDGHCRLRALVHSDVSDAEIARRYPRVERAQRDLLDASSLGPAFAGVDRVFLLTPSVPEQLRLEENALAAALNAGVRRIVYVSSTDVGWEIELSAAHRVIERRLAESGVDHTVLRPEYLLNNLLGEVEELARGRLVAPSADGRCPFVDARDVGAVAAAVLLAAEPLPGPLEVTGPESLSFTQLARRLQMALRRPIEHIDPDPAEWARDVVSEGMPPWLAEALAEYFEKLRERPLEASDHTRRVIGRSPRSVEDFADDVLAPAMPATQKPTTPVLVSPSGDPSGAPLVATTPTTHRSEHA
ncbi:MAG TPA: NAD(P)H-binding protein [Solirubrobacteraceae bacterium]|nr:NAD(P)H-binding protein [Solirubrobacteraceae bacterium]